MEPKKRGRGRPAFAPGGARRLPVYGSDEDMELARALAARWGVSISEAFRRAVRQAAKREKVSAGGAGGATAPKGQTLATARLVPSSKSSGVVPDRIGGKPLPVSRTRREFGLRAFARNVTDHRQT